MTNKAGAGVPFTGSAATRHGVKYEDWARMLYEYEMGTTVREYGLLPHTTEPNIAASPDGISFDGVAVEIKCPASKTLSDIPPEYYAQMQGQLEVTRLDLADFVVCRAQELDEPEFWQLFTAAHDAGYGYERFGAVGTLSATEFAHSPPGLSPEQLRVWISQLPAGTEVSVHHVFDFKITRIERDAVYVADMIRELNATWKEVIQARSARSGPAAAAKPKVSPVLKGFSFKNFGPA